MADYQLYRFFDDRPKTYREAIRHFLQTHRQLPAAVVVGPRRLDEARQAMAQINADLTKAGLAEEAIPLEVVGGCLFWEVGLEMPQNGHASSNGHGG